MVKSELIKKLCDMWPNMLRKDMEKIFEIVFSEITKALSKGESIEIRGFGTYKIRRKKARIGRNPKNSEAVSIPEKNSIKWKMSKTFFSRLNKNFTEIKTSKTY